MFKMVMDGKLFHVPLQDPKKILDIGTGSGIWPIEMGTSSHILTFKVLVLYFNFL
jgi:tRNA1(Val) A37 N6-methylase TrmN6